MLQQTVVFTALMYASLYGRVEAVRTLLSKGAKVNVVTKNGVTPLSIATNHKNDEIIKMLKAAGAKKIIPKNQAKLSGRLNLSFTMMANGDITSPTLQLTVSHRDKNIIS